MRSNRDLGKAGRGGFDARHGREQIEIRMRAPGVAIGASLAGRFGESRQPLDEHVLPGSEFCGVAICEAGFIQGAGKIEPEVVGGLSETLIFEDAFDYAAVRGAICVAAAGNEGQLVSSAITRHQWVIPVAACDRAGHPAAASNLGHSIGRRGLLAPGEGIRSLEPENEEFTVSGTSCATPFVAGAAALLWSEFPKAKVGDIWQALNLGHVSRRTSVVPPLLDAWQSYQWLGSHFEGTQN